MTPVTLSEWKQAVASASLAPNPWPANVAVDILCYHINLITSLAISGYVAF